LTSGSRVIDADGHVTEPPELWETHLEPAYRPRAIRIVWNLVGLEVLSIDGRRHHVYAPGTLGVLGGIGMDPTELLEPGRHTYREACPAGGYDPSARLKVMDAEGIDAAVLFPTIGHRDFDPLWAECQGLGLPVALHVVAREDRPLAAWWRGQQRELGSSRSGYMFHFAFLTLPVVAAFTSLLQGGTLERFPGLKVAILESGVGWIAHWLERLDGKYRLLKAYTPLRRLPSEYFRRQCWISAEPEETTIPMIVSLLGAERVIWASDYPHVDASLGVVETLRERIDGLPPEAQRRILGGNAARLYGLGG
jgi:hypothetical protein